MNRRGFLGSIIAACAAPAIVRADALMRVVPINTTMYGYDFRITDGHILMVQFDMSETGLIYAKDFVKLPSPIPLSSWRG